MAGLQLFVFICFFHEIQAQVPPPPPTLIVNSPLISKKDSVTLNCSTQTSVSQCHYEFNKEVRVSSCLQTLTGTSLLQISQQSSPAKVHIECFYTTKLGDVNLPSPHSEIYSILILSQKPQLSVHHSPGEPVLFTCSLPESDEPVTKCNLYFGEESLLAFTKNIWGKTIKTKQPFCQFSVTTDDLLRWLRLVNQKVASCDCTFESGLSSLSPRSNRYSLTDIMDKESQSLQNLIMSTMSSGPPVGMPQSPPVTPSIQKSGEILTDVTVSPSITQIEPASGPPAGMPQSPPVTPSEQLSGFHLASSTVVIPQPSPVTPSIQKSGKIVTDVTVFPSKTQKEPASGPPAGMPQSPPVMPSELLSGFHLASSTVVIPQPSPVTPSIQKSATWRWEWVVISVGVAVGAVLMGLALRCTKIGAERCFDKRKQTEATVPEDSMYMNVFDKGNLLPKGSDGFYSVITSVPGADCSVGNEKTEKEVQLNEESVVYHIYSTISEDHPAATLKP